MKWIDRICEDCNWQGHYEDTKKNQHNWTELCPICESDNLKEPQ